MSRSDRLYNLLPAVYRIRDVSQGEPLRALFAIIEGEVNAIEADIAGLYENWFIETCQEWAVPYVGDLLGVRSLKPIAGGTFTARSFVAHTLRYRRQKGTAAMLEQLARDVTNWPARVVEPFQFLNATQYLNHLRPQNPPMASLRNTDDLELVGGPFDPNNHTVEIRSAANSGGKYNVPNLAIYLWRLSPYPLTRTTARPDASGNGRYRFSVAGLDLPLFNQPPPLLDAERVTAENQVPGTLRRRALYEDLENLRHAIVDGRKRESIYFGDRPVAAISVAGVAIPPEQIAICDLSNQPLPPGSWPQPPATLKYTPSAGGAEVTLPIQVSIDPLLGRMAFAPGAIPPAATPVLVSYSYDFAGNLGGGPYDRTDSLPEPAPADKRPWFGFVSKDAFAKDIPPASSFTTLTDAISTPSTGWNAQPPGTFGILTILDSQTYSENLAITVPEDSQLLVVASGVLIRSLTDVVLEPVNLRPHIAGNIQVTGTLTPGGVTPGRLILNGLLLEGNITALPGNLGGLQLVHCTLIPNLGSVQSTGNPNLETIFNRTICGPISLGPARLLSVIDSILDGGKDVALAAPSADTSIQSSTILGAVGSSTASGVRTLQASNSIFTGPIFSERRQAGCLRFCSVGRDSRTPRRYRCQPDMALKDVTDAQAQAAIRARLAPQFTSLANGQAGYGQLSQSCATEISQGAEDGSQMGAFDFTKQPYREDNLRTALDEYLRFGLDAGVFFVT